MSLKRKRVIVENYNSQWPKIFEELKTVLLGEIKNYILSIEHVGSTSVNGMAAKPVIDLDIIVDGESNKKRVIQLLADLGYKHLGDLGIKGREAFSRTTGFVPLCENKEMEWMSHNLYVCQKGNLGLLNHLCLRDYLRNNSEAVKEYSSLKLDLAKKYPEDIDSYIDGKTDFILKILNDSGFSSEARNLISEQNKIAPK